MVRHHLALHLDPLILEVLGHLGDAVLEAGELDHDPLASLPDHMGLLHHDHLVVDGVLCVVHMDAELAPVDDSHCAVLQFRCLAVHFRFLLDRVGLSR